MEPSRKKLETIVDQLNLTPTDLEMISQTKKKKKIQYVTVTIFELILGVLSFIIGYMSIAPESEVIGYPFLTPLIMGSNLSISTQIKKKPLILVGFISLIILLIGLYSGHVAGIAMKTTNNYQYYGPTRYGVYGNEIISSH
ncbi:MAG: hypothetical protein ACXADY_24905 [Candidatus Hodarchaeales archaeon]|jgi:hypothetical protein